MKKRVLLVDDNSINLDVLEGHLSPLGHEILRATDGRSALAMIEAEPPDLILLDLVMPDFDGLETLAHIRAHEQHGHIPVILVTAHSERRHRLRGLEAGADEFLEKPIDPPILVARVRTLLRLKAYHDDLKLSRDELSTRNVALERLQQEQRELTAFLVHDLKTPLTAALLGIEWASEHLEPEQRDLAEALADAHEATTRIQSMIGDLLTISRLEHLEDLPRPVPIPLSELIVSVLPHYERMATGRKVRISSHLETDQKVSSDPALLRRVFENLLDNAIRHTPESGRIDVAVQPGRNVVIAVSNTGRSIPAGERARIFEKFSRGGEEQTTTSNAGLGLHFCKRVVEAYGGRIGVIETPEWPTSFVVRLAAA